jgi:beta-lactamase class C
VPSLRGSKFGEVRLLELGTHTPGGLPLQVPDNVTNDAQLLQYLQRWRPAYAPGTVRTYSNISIGVLGLIAAKSMDQSYVGLVERRLFPALGMTNSYMNVPALKMKDYAQGYTASNRPIRMTEEVLWPQAYGVKTTATDLIRFVRDNMQMTALDEKLQRSIMATHTGYFKAGVMTQDLIWEQYPYPTPLSVLLQGNAPKMAFEPNRVTPIRPSEAPRDDVWLNKTGSTNGFSAYVAFVPKERMGIVILANKSYPIAQRIRLAYRILGQLAAKAAQ